jgi:hypothetical protein
VRFVEVEMPLSSNSPFVDGEKKAEALLDLLRWDGEPAGLSRLLRSVGVCSGVALLLGARDGLKLLVDVRVEGWPCSTEASGTTAGIFAPKGPLLLSLVPPCADILDELIWRKGSGGLQRYERRK